MTQMNTMEQQLTGWLGNQLPDADEVRVEGIDRVDFGHSAEMMVFTVVVTIGLATLILDLIYPKLDPRITYRSA